MDLVAKAFGTYARLHDECERWYLLHSHYDWAASALGLLDGDLVAHWGIWRYRMRIGRALVRCGGVGAVATTARHRRRGLMVRTAPHSLARMRARGYHLSVLFGIHGYHGRFGYVSAWPESRWHLGRADLPGDLPRLTLRRIPALPRPELVRLHNQCNRGLTGTAVRPTYGSWCAMREGVDAYCWGPPDRPEGHVLVQGDGPALVCLEATGDPEAALSALSRRRALPQLRFEALPYRSALAARLRALNSRYEQQYASAGDAMVRLLDLRGCLGAMLPELSARLAASELRDYRGRIAVEGPEGAVGLVLAAGRVALGPARPSRSAVRGGWAWPGSSSARTSRRRSARRAGSGSAATPPGWSASSSPRSTRSSTWRTGSRAPISLEAM